MAGSVQRQKVYVQVTDWRLFGEGIASGLDYARKPRQSPPNNSALCSHPRPGPVDIAVYLPRVVTSLQAGRPGRRAITSDQGGLVWCPKPRSKKAPMPIARTIEWQLTCSPEEADSRFRRALAWIARAIEGVAACGIAKVPVLQRQ